MDNNTDLKLFIQKSRTTQEEKQYWAERIISKALSIVEEKGRLIEIKGLPGKAQKANIGGMSLLYVTPFTGAVPYPKHPRAMGINQDLPNGERSGNKRYMLDISTPEEGKVFSSLLDPMNVTKFKRGDWIMQIGL